MKQVDKIPEEGQFVAIYNANNKIWSDTFFNDGGCILQYSDETDDFEPLECDIVKHLQDHKAIFFTL